MQPSMGGSSLRNDRATDAPSVTEENSENLKQGTLIEEPENWVFAMNNETLTFKIGEIVGKGTFGTVHKARNVQTNENVAIKRTIVPDEHESIEVSMLTHLRHRNIVNLKQAFSSPLPGDERELFIITEYVSCDLNVILNYYHETNTRMKGQYIMVYMYQLLKGLEFIHRVNVAHRDLKPSNILICLSSHALKICDFGSAKVLIEDRSNASYVCSRYYRAPELLMGCRYYTTAVDIWSCGCIMAEMYLGTPLFTGNERYDQLRHIEAVLGTPTYNDFIEFGQRRIPPMFRTFCPRSWRTIFGESICDQAIDLISNMVKYSPQKRFDAAAALRHPFFNPLRKANFTLPTGAVPRLFDSEEELEMSSNGTA